MNRTAEFEPRPRSFQNAKIGSRRNETVSWQYNSGGTDFNDREHRQSPPDERKRKIPRFKPNFDDWGILRSLGRTSSEGTSRVRKPSS